MYGSTDSFVTTSGGGHSICFLFYTGIASEKLGFKGFEFHTEKSTEAQMMVTVHHRSAHLKLIQTSGFDSELGCFMMRFGPFALL
jgi:hypothetical protein